MISKIALSIQGKKIILFGEVHGTKEIPLMLAEFFSEYARKHDFDICMEIPASDQLFIDTFFQTGDEENLRNMSFFKENRNLSDGRNSLEYYQLIKGIQSINKCDSKNIHIFCIDVDEFTPDEDFATKRDKALAENIVKHSTNKQIFAILGNFHVARAASFKTAASFIPKKYQSEMLTINLIPRKGSFFNIGVQIVEYDSSIREYYDLNIELAEVSPCTFIS